MHEVFRCSRGHQWEGPEEGPSSATVVSLACPVCGAEDVTSIPTPKPAPAAPASREEGTLVISEGAPVAAGPDRTSVLPGLARGPALPDQTLPPSIKGSIAPVDAADETLATDPGPKPAANWLEPTLADSPPPRAPAPAANWLEPTLADNPPPHAPAPDATCFVPEAYEDTRDETLQLPGAKPGPLADTSDATLASASPLHAAATGPEEDATLAPPGWKPVGDMSRTFQESVGPSTEPLPDALSETLAPSSDVQLESARPRISPPSADYEILGELGRGAMGVVYKARQVGLNRLVALKMILAGGHASAHELARFHIEAEAVARLQHPNIVQVYDVGEQDGRPYFSLEYVDGGSLAQKMQGAPQPPVQSAQWMRALAQAMDSAHRHGIIHRDLKPANVLLTKDGTPKITDFGLAKQLEADDSQTRTGTILGTPSYMAPEQAGGKTKETGPSADIYSLGAILYDLLTGRPPFRGETVMDTLQQVQSIEPVPPRRLQPKLHSDVETICLKCLQKDPSKRYASAGDLAEDLRRYLEGEPILARPTPAWERAVKWARRRPALAALVGVSVAAVLGLLVVGAVYERRVRHERDVAVTERERADEEKSRAEHERDAARKARDEAERARIAAKRERDRATRHFEDALAAVGLVNRLGQEQSLVDAPRTEKLRRDLLERALPFYERFLEVKSEDPVVRAEAGQAFLRVGDIREMLAQPQKAEEAYQRAVVLFQGLRTEYPDEPEYRRQLASCYNNLGILLATFSGRQPEAEHAHQQALEVKSELVARFADNPDYRLDLARSYNNRGNFRQIHKQDKEADEDYRAAVKVLEKLVEEFRTQPEYRQELVRTHVHRATLQTVNRSPEAEQTYRTALDLQRQLVAEHPRPEYLKELARIEVNFGVLLQLNQQLPEAEKVSAEAAATLEKLTSDFSSVLDYQQLLGISYSNLEILLKKRQRWPEAEDVCRKAIAAWERLAKELPGEPFARQKLGMSQNELGYLLGNQLRSAAAEKAWREAAITREKLAADFPTEPKYWKEATNTYTNLAVLLTSRGMLVEAVETCRQLVAVQRKRLVALPSDAAIARLELGRALNRLADLCVQQADHDEAAKSAGEAEQLVAPASAEYAQAALVLGRCMLLADRDTRLAEDKRKELVKKYGDLTVAMLRKAAAAGSKEIGDLKDNPGFDLLRSREDFKKLSADLSAGAKGGTQ